MIALHAERVRGRLAGRRQLPAAAVGELEAGAGVGAGARRVPLRGNRDLLREVQRYRPAAQRSGAGIGDTHIHLEECAPGVGRRRRTGVSGVCLACP